MKYEGQFSGNWQHITPSDCANGRVIYRGSTCSRTTARRPPRQHNRCNMQRMCKRPNQCQDICISQTWTEDVSTVKMYPLPKNETYNVASNDTMYATAKGNLSLLQIFVKYVAGPSMTCHGYVNISLVDRYDAMRSQGDVRVGAATHREGKHKAQTSNGKRESELRWCK